MNYHLSLFTWRGVQKAACLGWAIWGQRQWLVLMLIARITACEIYQMSPIALALCCMTAYNSMTKKMLPNINISPSIVGKKKDPGMLRRMYKSSHFLGHPYFIQDSPKTRLHKKLHWTLQKSLFSRWDSCRLPAEDSEGSIDMVALWVDVMLVAKLGPGTLLWWLVELVIG